MINNNLVTQLSFINNLIDAASRILFSRDGRSSWSVFGFALALLIQHNFYINPSRWSLMFNQQFVYNSCVSHVNRCKPKELLLQTNSCDIVLGRMCPWQSSNKIVQTPPWALPSWDRTIDWQYSQCVHLVLSLWTLWYTWSHAHVVWAVLLVLWFVFSFSWCYLVNFL